MKTKPTAQPVRRGLGQGGFFNLRALTALLLCAAAAFSMVTGTLLGFFRPPAQPASYERTLTAGERIAYQRAIEEVYWRHRIWPKENSKPKPSLDEVMSAQQIEGKVEDYLRDAQALEDYWQRPITPDELQAEMERIASYTKQPAMLRELFEALGNDPFLIAECLARPVLAERLLTNVNAHYQSIHGELKVLPEYRRASADNRAPYSMAAAGASYRLPTVSDRPDGCSDQTWTTISTTNAPAARASHTAVWTGSEMIVWGGYGGTYLNTGGRYDPSTDSWTAISTINAPAPRGGNTAVWTGSEMIVWGGDDGFSVNTGGRYNPATDTWTATNTATAPIGRIFHTAVWDGSEMIVWGGWNEFELRSGGRYNPGTDSWAATSITNAPSARFDHAAVWTGSEMIVWGGWNGSNSFNTGGRYNPGTDGWTASSTTNAPVARYDHTGVWTGNEMIVWGGRSAGNYFNTGGKYNPSTDNWAATSTTNAPGARFSHTAVWTGSDMIVWGGTNMLEQFNTGGRYNPGTDNWMATTTSNAPERRAYHTAVWSGSEMVVWGGLNDLGPFFLNTGGRYCAQPSPTDTPTPTPTAPSTPSPTSTPVQCNLGESFDFVMPPALPAGWTATNGTNPDGILWQTSNSGLPSPPADSPPNAAWVNDPAAISDKYLNSPPIENFILDHAFLSFRNNYSLEASQDGGVLEISIDDGPFQDILAAGGSFIGGGYNGTISACCGNPLAGRQAWTGSSGGFIGTTVDISVGRGHTIVLRWRMGSDSSVSGQGWRVDNVQMVCEGPSPTPTSTPTSTATPTPTPTLRAAPTPRPRPTPAPRP